MAISNAWLLDIGLVTKVAVGVPELQHLVDDPQFIPVANGQNGYKRVFNWQGNSLTVIDIAHWLEKKTDYTEVSLRPLVGVFAYQDRLTGSHNTGALSLCSIPKRVQVNDTQACALPNELVKWRDIAISCFSYDGNAVPIIDLSVLFHLAGLSNKNTANQYEQITNSVSGF